MLQVEIVYYPLAEPLYSEIIKKLLAKIAQFSFKTIYTSMSTIIQGEKSEILRLVKLILDEEFELYPSILELKFSNAC